ncbi:right-handed parallel beta-helix repeat-containing protein [Polymorphospora rubra]|uniref:right-handed parallel beta-helix repeat-containing protein n=2 Tax=Polymorphospora rubra TaxID=338584 RepID=UPI0031E29C89
MTGIDTTGTNARRGGATADGRRHRHRGRRTLVLAGLTAAGLLTTLLTVQPVWAATFTVTSTADAVDANIGDGVCRTAANTCTLRAAVQEANASLPGDTIQVPAGTYQLTRAPAGDNGDGTGDLDIVSPVTIVGAGPAHTIVDGGQPPAGAPPERRGLDRLLEIHDTAGNVTLSGLTLREGYDPEQGGALLSESPGLLRLQDVAVLDSYAGVTGGGIDLDGEGRVEISGAVVRGNATGGDGGGIHNQHEVELTLTDTTLADNTAGGDGGGVSSTSKTRLTVTRGTVSGNAAGGEGGGVLADSERATTVRGTVFTGNTAGDPVSGDGGGAGLYLGGSGGATVTGASFAANEAVAEGGGVAIHSGGPVTIGDSTVRDNHSDAGGGGIENSGMRVTLLRLTVTGNSAGTDGGGIESQGSGALSIVDTSVSRNTATHGGGFANVADGTLHITGSTFWDNRATEYGGGIYNASDADSLIENTTSSGNVAQVAGGGLYTDADAGLRVVNVTVNRNVAPRGSGVGDEPGGSVNFPVEPSTSVILRNTIVAGNLHSPECSFAVGSEGGNLDSADSCHLRGSRDRTNAGDPRIDAIADNGGPTMTHALQVDSFALDGGVAPCGTVDQRGITRPRNSGCDIGALEHEGPFPAADNTPPDTSVASGPLFAAERVTFRFAGTDDVTPAGELLFECRVLTNDPTDPPDPPDPTEPPDPEFVFVGCPNPYELLDVEMGQNTLEVRAIDRAGNVDPTPAVHVFTGGDDITPPETVFASTPPDPSAGRTAVFSFLGTDDLTPTNLIGYECRIDSTDEEAWLECASPWSFANLTTGSHTVQVRAVDEGDNVDPTPATYTWTVSSPVDCDASNVILGADADAYVDESVTTQNFGIAEALTVRSSAPGEDARTLVRFPLPTDVPAACELTGATLRLYGDGDGGRTLEAAAAGAPWSEMQVTWANQPLAVGPAATTTSGGGFREWNVTAQVATMLAGGANHGFVIRDAAEEGDGAESSFASRNTVAEPPRVPQLVLRFDGPGAPQPPPPPAPVPTTVTCGQVVTHSILVRNDLTDCPLDGLVIGAPNVVVDLDGHTIDGPGYFPGQPGSPVELPELGLPAGIRNVGFENVVVTGGTVRQFGYGVVLMAGTRFNRISGLTVRENAVAGVELADADDGRNANEVRDNVFDANEIGLALVAGAENSVVRDNTFTGNLGVALHLRDASGHLVEGNTVSGVTADPTIGSDGGFLLEDARDNRLLDNTLADTGDGGIIVSDGSHRNRVEGNTMTRTGDAGVSVEDSDGNQVTGNVAHLASDVGVGLSGATGTVVRGNDVRFNPGGVALEESSDNLVESNDASRSGGAGISVGAGSLRNRILDNTVHGSAGGGISVDGAAVDPEGNPLDGNTVERNSVVGNQGDGISVAEAGHRLAGNTAHHNAAFGIDAAEDTVDGGGNTAGGNGEAEQCQGVVCGPGTPGAPPAPDQTAPDTVLTTTPPNPSSSLASVHFGFTGTDDTGPPTALRFQCRLDPPPDPPAPEPEPGEPPQPPDVDNWVECVSLTTYHFLFAGVHRFEVRAVDPADNVDLTPATYTWTVAAVPPGPDTTPPNTTIFSMPDLASTSPVATFGFRGSDNASPGPNLRYECRIDTGTFGPCLSPKSYAGLALGGHTFEVRAVDLAGNADPTPATYTWTISPAPADTTPPDTTIDSAPDASTVATGATFTFSAGEPGSTFECSLDGAAFAACTSPQVYTGLWATDHEFRVRATDPAGNTDPTPAAHAWTVRPAPVPSAVTCGQTLTRSVLLTNGLTNCSGDGLVVGAAGITVDLNGFAVDGVGQGNGIRNNGHDQVTITNGTVREFDHGVQLNAGTAGNIVDGLTLEENQEAGIQLVDADNGTAGNLIRDNQFTANADGIALTGGTRGTLIRDNTIGGSTRTGIHLDGGSGNRIEANRISGGSGTGVWLVGATGNTVTGNTVLDHSDAALTLEEAADDNRIEGNDLTGSEAGIVVTDSGDNDIIANVATNHSDTGISLENSRGNVLRGNDVRFNSSGIDLAGSSGNRIESNDASDSSSGGIWLGDGSLDNVVTLNTASGNSAEGISVEAEVLPGSTDPGNVIDRNITNNNDSAGVYVGKAGHRISANTADNNNGWGIYAETGNVDGGGNRATGNSEPEQCHQIRCDGSAPTPPEVAPPDTVIVDEPPNPSNSTSASFTFTGIDDNTPLPELGFECRLDSTSETAWVECENPRTYGNLAPGTHTFEVRAVDLSDKVDPTPATYTWVVALSPPGVPPVTTISAGPPAQTAARSALFTFFANEPDATFECSLDGAPYAACVSPVFHEDLLPGTHEFRVRARDAEGNLEPTPATRIWTVTGPPVVTLVLAPEAEQTSTTATFAFVANEPVARFECSLDLAPFTTCVSPVEYTGLAIGDHYLRVRAVDLDGVTSTEEEMAEHEWEIVPGPDTTPPETTVDSGPADPATATSATFTFSGTDDVTAPAGLLFECRLDSQNEADFVECTSPHGYPNVDLPDELAPGPHVFEVRALDQEDNVDPTPARHEWTVAGTPVAPQTTIVAAPPPATASTTATFTFSASQPGVTFECALDAAAFAPCASPVNYTGLAVGDHEFAVRARTAGGVTDQTPAVFGWTVQPPPDTTAPQTSIATGPAQATASPAASFTFTADEAGSTFECSLDAAPFGPCASPAAYSGLAPGGHQFRVRATDAAGNVDATPATWSWTVTPPVTCAAPGSVTLGANADSWVLQSSASSNYGTDSAIKVDTKAGNNARVLVRFNLPAIPSGCQVVGAKLRMYAGSYKTGRTLQAVPLAANWSEANVRWNNQPATTGAPATVASGSGYREWTVTGQVGGMYATGNFGFLIRDATENGSGVEQAFHSREKGSDNPPRLVITFG